MAKYCGDCSAFPGDGEYCRISNCKVYSKDEAHSEDCRYR